jgi:hypothetical protein
VMGISPDFNLHPSTHCVFNTGSENCLDIHQINNFCQMTLHREVLCNFVKGCKLRVVFIRLTVQRQNTLSPGPRCLLRRNNQNLLSTTVHWTFLI